MIDLTVTLGPDDYRAFSRLMQRRINQTPRARAVRIATGLGLGVAAGLAFHLAGYLDRDAFLGGMAFGIGSMLVFQSLALRRAMRAYDGIGGMLTGVWRWRVDDEALHIEHALFSKTVRWSGITGMIEADGRLFLMTGAMAALIIPLATADQAQAAAFTAELRRRLAAA